MKVCFPLVLVFLFISISCGDAADGNGRGEEAGGKIDNSNQSMTVFCGSANKPAMEKIAKAFEKETGIEINLIFGGSGTLLSQLELSKKGEIYLPGSPDYISIGLRKKLLIEGSDRIVAYLVPALITPAGNPAGIRKLEDLAKPGVRVGIGNPKSVCLGLYSIELLETAGLTDDVLKNVVTFGGSCSKTANLASLKQVDAILGWRVFHFWNPSRMEFVAIEPDKIPRISYIPISIPIYTKDKKLSERFIEYVLSDKGLGFYNQFGYISDEGKARAFAPAATIGGEYKLPDDYFERVKESVKD